MNDTSLVTFKAITTFTNELGELFGDQQRSLKLYCRLINHTTIAHDKPIQKHIEAFRLFCITNRDAIIGKNISQFINTKVEYSERVYIDFSKIFSKSDTETTEVIWKHLLLISALVDPSGNAKDILKKYSSGGEQNFLKNIMDKVGKHADPNANPTEAVSSMMNSGVFPELINGMQNGIQDGSLDLNKLMGAVQSMVTSFGGEDGESGEGETNPMNMIGSVMKNLMGTGGMEGDQPNIMSMLGPLLGSLGGKGGMGGMEGDQPNIMSMLGPLLGSLGGTGGMEGEQPNIMSMLGNLNLGEMSQEGENISSIIDSQVATKEKKDKQSVEKE
jgi:hypothetical protein